MDEGLIKDINQVSWILCCLQAHHRNEHVTINPQKTHSSWGRCCWWAHSAQHDDAEIEEEDRGRQGGRLDHFLPEERYQVELDSWWKDLQDDQELYEGQRFRRWKVSKGLHRDVEGRKHRRRYDQTNQLRLSHPQSGVRRTSDSAKTSHHSENQWIQSVSILLKILEELKRMDFLIPSRVQQGWVSGIRR